MRTHARAHVQLAGVKIRKRKKDIKAKYEPEEFRDQLVQELKPVANESAETVGKHLDSLSEKLDYKTYGETLFDVLFTGGMLGTRRTPLPLRLPHHAHPFPPRSHQRCIASPSSPFFG